MLPQTEGLDVGPECALTRHARKDVSLSSTAARACSGRQTTPVCLPAKSTDVVSFCSPGQGPIGK